MAKWLHRLLNKTQPKAIVDCLVGQDFPGKNKIPLNKKQVINKSTRVIFGLVQLVILDKKGIIRWKNSRLPMHAKYFMPSNQTFLEGILNLVWLHK